MVGAFLGSPTCSIGCHGSRAESRHDRPVAVRGRPLRVSGNGLPLKTSADPSATKNQIKRRRKTVGQSLKISMSEEELESLVEEAIESLVEDGSVVPTGELRMGRDGRLHPVYALSEALRKRTRN